jgi:serine/threonine protein kinase
MEKIEPLNPCSVLPSTESVVNEECLTKMSQYYAFGKRLGSGLHALTISVVRENHQVAIKMLRKNYEAVKEIHILCKINEVRFYTPILGETYGWAMCHAIPGDWLKYIKDNFGNAQYLKNHKKDYVFIAMEMNSHRLEELEYTEEDLIMMFFLLLHGIAVMRSGFPFFRHRDIHPGNVMIKLITPSGLIWHTLADTNVYINNKFHVTLKHLQRIPRLIDFGEARFRKEPEPLDDETQWNNEFFDDRGIQYFRRNDLYRIGHWIIKFMYKKMDIDQSRLLNFLEGGDFYRAANAETNNYELIEKCLEHDYFKIPNIQWKPLVSRKNSNSDIDSQFLTPQHTTNVPSIWKQFLPNISSN